MKDWKVAAKLAGTIVGVCAAVLTWTENHFTTHWEHTTLKESHVELKAKVETDAAKRDALSIQVGTLVAVMNSGLVSRGAVGHPGAPAQETPPAPDRKQGPDEDELTRQVEEILRRECERLPRPGCPEKEHEKAER